MNEMTTNNGFPHFGWRGILIVGSDLVKGGRCWLVKNAVKLFASIKRLSLRYEKGREN